MQFFVNGQAVSLEGMTDFAQLELPRGQHRVEYRYQNTLHVFFVQALRVYLLLLLCMLIGLISTAIYRASKSIRVSGVY